MTTAPTPRPGGKPVGGWLWRWRNNPLRRLSDRVEAWLVLGVWLAAVLGGAVAGLVAADSVGHALDARRAQTRPVPAVLTEDAPRTVPVTEDGSGGDTVWARVRWTSPDGATHTGRAQVAPAAEAGTRVTVWAGPSGGTGARPPTLTESAVQAAVIGTLAGLGTAATAWLGGRLARAQLDRRRLAQWEAEWRQVGPRWRKRMTG
ncbi:hypothetical protein SUDANB105_07034 [Streptomyces sp. enrichment culture]|uniref:Rv1733c family protein n=1 Tax=Streptomyces sp. enrichment culture TaxID=1795815 RepID=UPI003F5676DA